MLVGLTHRVVIDIVEISQLPTVTLVLTPNFYNHLSSAVLTYTATATDNQDGDLTAAIVWTVDSASTGQTGGTFTTTGIALGPGSHSIVASVTDIDGNTGEATFVATAE